MQMTQHLQNSFNAGIAQHNLPAYAGLDLSGYAARHQPSTDVRDAVSTTALAMENGDTLFILISVDALGFAVDVAERVRGSIAGAARKIGPWKDIQVCLAATHSHSAPASMSLRECGNVNPLWLQETCDIITQTALESVTNMQPARFGVGNIPVPDVSLNRRGGTSADDELTAWRIDLKSGKPLAMVLNYACHPVVLTAENRAISADYPGEVRRVLQEEMQIPVLFLTGAAGDINPIHRGDTDALKRIAEPLIQGVKEMWPQIDTSSKVLMRGSSTRLDLPLSARPPREELVTIAATDSLSANRAWAEQALLSPSDAPLTVPCAVQVWQIGSSALAAMGCEFFSSLGLRLKSTYKDEKFASPMIAAYANGNLGYVPDADAYERGGYEVNDAHHYYAQPACVAPEAGEMIIDAVVQGINFLERK